MTSTLPEQYEKVPAVHIVVYVIYGACLIGTQFGENDTTFADTSNDKVKKIRRTACISILRITRYSTTRQKTRGKGSKIKKNNNEY